ncbi:urease accessory protein UreH domain-containing protein [Anaerocolumna xylanovorans]|uniref:Sulfite exporter TauE/SafE n=1 Tax=Anaerocolumna xylanovorans DSM 12503 TaxID=1121345 RepID=A0A1M7YFF7_9FIRM|nr:sulfite exporter TauE/SafE family protein [Anaerocolumna xylanovorans]SHO51375.1 Sulfite exporter TauE/SafE [Anaerocolumna xylanovorans DSM 12503]
MGAGTKTKKLRIGGMTCVSCQNKIEKKLRNTAGIEMAEVSYNAGTAVITYDTDIILLKNIAQIIESLDYKVLPENEGQESDLNRIIEILIIIASFYMILQHFGILNLLVPSKLADVNMGYGMLFVIGLVTSVHCVAMCGGINLSQCIPYGEGGDEKKSRFSAFRPAFLYNLGRVISYTAVGFIVGALGSVITFSNTLQGILKLIAGVFMVVMGINMLGIAPWLRKFNPRMPRIFASKVYKKKANSKSPLIVGLLNGLMPCGPLQAMQIYALSTGNPFAGAFSMFLFSLGTVPLMFGLGVFSAALGKKFAHRVMTAGAVLVVVLGLSMFSQGWSLSGFHLSVLSQNGGEAVKDGGSPVKIENGVQIVNSTLSSGRYPNIEVQAGTPVKWTIDAPKGSINGCNNRMLIREYGIEYSFKTGENVIEFTPTKTGKVQYTCWMGMIRGSINVVEAGDVKDTANAAGSGEDNSVPDDLEEEDLSAEPIPAGYAIPTDAVAIAKEIKNQNGDNVQQVTIELTDDGFKAAVMVVKSGLNAEWNIIDNSSDQEGIQLLVPYFQTQLQLEKGENPLYFIPTESFDFSTGDNAFYGYVKVVDSPGSVDVDAVKAEVQKFKTQIWPPETFQPAGSGASCH